MILVGKYILLWNSSLDFFFFLVGDILLQTADESELDLMVTRVTKQGRTTGHTTGMYSEFGIYKVYDDYLQKENIYFHCYKIDDEDDIFCKDGDSGSGVLIEETNKAFGLLIANSKLSPESLVCDIQEIVKLFELDLYRWV